MSDVTVDQNGSSLQPPFVSSSAVSTDVSTVNVTSHGYDASSSSDTSGWVVSDLHLSSFVILASFFVKCNKLILPTFW